MSLPPAKAETLHFAAPPDVPDPYKYIRMQEWAYILETEFPDMIPNRDLLLGHLFHECPVMSEDCAWVPGSSRSDHGFAIGIAQWHIPSRYRAWATSNKFIRYYIGEDGKEHWTALRPTTEIRSKFYADHPDMQTHFGQFRKYISDMRLCLSGDNRLRVKDDIYSCIRLWNWGAGRPYFTAVESAAAVHVPKYLTL